MYIRSLCAAAVVAVGVGQADAATVVNYDLWLRYEGTAFEDVFYASTDPESNYYVEGDFAADAMLPGMKSHLFGSIAIGDIIHMMMRIVHPEVPDDNDLVHGNGGRTPICKIGAWSCVKTNYTSAAGFSGWPNEDVFTIAYEDIWYLTGETSIGSHITANFWTGAADFPFTSDDGRYWYWYDYEFSNFTVVPPPSPVPLPATVALLPLGVGALALMRRRRRSLS